MHLVAMEKRAGGGPSADDHADDLISALGGDVLVHILRLVGDARDVVRTGALSRRWRGLCPRPLLRRRAAAPRDAPRRRALHRLRRQRPQAPRDEDIRIRNRARGDLAHHQPGRRYHRAAPRVRWSRGAVDPVRGPARVEILRLASSWG